MQAAHIGVVRDVMLLANPLLIKPSLGKTKTRGLLYQGPDFVYGTSTNIQDGGVSEALSRWHVHSLPSGSSRAHVHRMGLDIVELNREGVKLGLVTAKEHYHYRATQFCRRCVPAPGPRRPPPTCFPLDTTFGISTRPSTPIGVLLEHQHVQHWQAEQHVKQRSLQGQYLNKAKLCCIQDTRTSLLRKNQPLPETMPLWKLPHLQKVGPALSTFRDTDTTQKAFNAQFSGEGPWAGNLHHSV
ncbi:cilia- and flagella-associated protein 77 [Osmerus mordax]|uniref:cilia- and flagella-associated protein 77 n=1 Tax=Osmerus mordax TaxID=8014 RepID=UPI00350FB484